MIIHSEFCKGLTCNKHPEHSILINNSLIWCDQDQLISSSKKVDEAGITKIIRLYHINLKHYFSLTISC